jgi:hypothetical protein
MKTPIPRSDELLYCINEKLTPSWLPLLIAIDGADGVGKSHLASWLAWQLGAPTIHLDLFYVKDAKPIQWRTDELKSAVRARGERPLIVEGIMILDALGTIERQPDFLVYVTGEGGYCLSHQLANYRERHKPEQRAHFCLEGFVERFGVSEENSAGHKLGL